jgi:hypothetical protein
MRAECIASISTMATSLRVLPLVIFGLLRSAGSLVQMVQRSDWQDIFSLLCALVATCVVAHFFVVGPSQVG